MAGFIAHGATFSFNGIVAKVTGMSVESPSAEVTDMTSVYEPANQRVLVPTGAFSGGSISVDYISDANGIDMQTVVGQVGELLFESRNALGSIIMTVQRQVILESASVDVRTAELVRGSLKFLMTDYYPS
jgi:hypothetical protein